MGIAYGGQGLAILLFFYFTAAAWAAFVLAWGWFARAASRWNFQRLDSAPLRRERDSSRPGEGETEASENHAFGVERDPLYTPDGKRRQPVPVL